MLCPLPPGAACSLTRESRAPAGCIQWVCSPWWVQQHRACRGAAAASPSLSVSAAPQAGVPAGLLHWEHIAPMPHDGRLPWLEAPRLLLHRWRAGSWVAQEQVTGAGAAKKGCLAHPTVHLPKITEMDQKTTDKASSCSQIVQHYNIRELVFFFFFCYAFDTFSCCLTFKIKKLSFFYNVEITWIFLGETPQHCS